MAIKRNGDTNRIVRNAVQNKQYAEIQPVKAPRAPKIESTFVTASSAKLLASLDGASAVVQRKKTVDPKYDYVVIGSGAGGAPVAARLAEQGYRVLVLEAGGKELVKESEPLGLHTFASENKALLTRGTGEFIRHRVRLEDDLKDPKFRKAGIEAAHPSGIFVPRGEGVGGSTLMNAGIFVRPDDVDWDHIAQATGDPSWKSSEMLKYFQKVENAEYQPVLKILHEIGKATNIEWLQNMGGHGFDGWLKVNRPLDIEIAKTIYDNPQLGRMIFETFKYSFTKVGSAIDRVKMLSTLLDPNHSRANNVEGMVVTPLTVTKEGRRNGPRDRLLDVASKHPDNLSILTNARVEKILFNEKNEAVAVRYRTQDGVTRDEPIKREVVLAAGAFETPAILMRSGVGPEAELDKLASAGVEKRVIRDGVGRHLKGRYEIGVVTRLKEPLQLLTETQFNADPNNPAYKKWKETGKGLLGANGIVAAFRIKSDPSKTEPDLYIFGVPGKFEGYVPGYSTDAVVDPHLVTWVILDENKGDENGTVVLNPNDINGRVRVNQRFHGDERPGDSMPLVNGIKIVRDLVRGYADIVEKEEWPGDSVRTDAELAQAVEENSWDHHPNGTAQIGAEDDPQAVVNKDLEVIGVKGVRVSDASVFPRSPGSFIQSSIMTVAEKGAASMIAKALQDDAAKGVLRPFEQSPSPRVQAKNTLGDNLLLAMKDALSVGRDGVLTERALRELFELTKLKGFSTQELADARAIAYRLDQNGNPNARVVAQLAEAIAVNRADQGFLLDIQARIDDAMRNASFELKDVPGPIAGEGRDQ